MQAIIRHVWRTMKRAYDIINVCCIHGMLHVARADVMSVHPPGSTVHVQC